MKQLFKYVFHLGFYAVVFLGLVWILLGFSPAETVERSREHLGALFGRAGHFAGNMGQTLGEMGDVADRQLQSASDRLHGKDPYAKLAEQLNAKSLEFE